MASGKSLFLLMICGFFTTCYGIEPSDIVETTKGPVQGKILSTVWNSVKYTAFEGIPYAQPPIGDRRFQSPLEVEPWTRTLNATQNGANCVQIDFVTNNLTGSEDCLYLNVYTPVTDFKNAAKAAKAVMVWIYGGSFKAGYSNSSLYGPDFFLEEDVLLVSFNYRLGPLGFLSLQTPGASGNAGLKDQNLVLKWVQKNIANFGGDPNNVTLFGQSAGSVSVEMHVLSDKSKGLFHRTISMSGSVFCVWGFQTPDVAVDRAFALGQNLGFKTRSKDELLKFLKNATAKDLVLATNNLTLIDLPFKPTLEDSKTTPESEIFLSECAVKKYKNQNFSRVPLLMGYTSDEALGFAGSVDQLQGLVNYVTSTINSLGAVSMLKSPDAFNWLTPGTNIVKNLTGEVADQLITAATDLLFVAPIDWRQKVVSKESPAPLYYYRLSFDSPHAWHRVQLNITHLNGTAHGDDLTYLFNTEILNVPLEQDNPLSVFRKKMVRLWSNFAKYSNPTPDGENDPLLGVTWPTSNSDGKQLDIGEELVVRDRLASPQALFYQQLVKATAPRESGCKRTIGSIISNHLGFS